MRILIVSTIFATASKSKIIGGAEVVASSLAQGLASRGHDILVVRAVSPSSNAFTEKTDFFSVKHVPIKNGYWPFDQRHRSAAARFLWHFRDDVGTAMPDDIIADFKPDIMHTHNISGLSTGAWRSAKNKSVPILHTLHDYYLLCPRTTMFRRQNCITLCKTCRALTQRRRIDSTLVDCVVSVSDAVLAAHRTQNIFVDCRSAVIRNSAPAALSQIAMLPIGKQVVFGFMGRPTLEKGVFHLIKEFVGNEAPAKLLVAGDISSETLTELKQIAGTKNIEFLGFVDTAQFLAQIHVLIVPSLWQEPLSIAVLEAQRAGRPVIGSRRGGIPEAIGSDKNGWLFDPGNLGTLTKIIRDLCSDPEKITEKALRSKSASHVLLEDEFVNSYERLLLDEVGRSSK